MKQVRLAKESLYLLLCAKHKQTFDKQQLNLLSCFLPPESAKFDERLAKRLVNSSTSAAPDDTFTRVFANWIIYSNSEAFAEMRKTDDSGFKLDHKFFAIVFVGVARSS